MYIQRYRCNIIFLFVQTNQIKYTSNKRRTGVLKRLAFYSWPNPRDVDNCNEQTTTSRRRAGVLKRVLAFYSWPNPRDVGNFNEQTTTSRRRACVLKRLLAIYSWPNPHDVDNCKEQTTSSRCVLKRLPAFYCWQLLWIDDIKQTLGWCPEETVSFLLLAQSTWCWQL
jgi:hypothetical protein